MSSLRLKLLTAALIGVLGASTAHAQNSYPSLFAGQNKPARVEPVRPEPVRTSPNRVDTSQQGRGNGGAVGQTGVHNGAVINQSGDNNTGQVNQTGAGNSAAIYQIGRNNNGAITQTGNNNAACILQVGRNNSATVTQVGNQNVGIAQTPRGTYEFPVILCALYGKDPQMLRRATMAYF